MDERYPDIAGAKGTDGTSQDAADAICASLPRLRRIALTVLDELGDPFVSSHEVDENANVLIDKIVKRWKRLAHETRCAIVLVHHHHPL